MSKTNTPEQQQYRSKPHGHCTHPRCREIWSAYLEVSERLAKYEPGATMHLNAATGQAKSVEPVNWKAHIQTARNVYSDYLDAQEALNYLEQVFFAATPAPPPAGERNEWKEAIMQGLCDTGMDAPVDMPPLEILNSIIAMRVMMAADPAINAPAAKSERAELIAWLLEKYHEESCGESGLKEAADMLEADVSLIDEGNKAQQVEVPCASLCELCIKRGYSACANAAKTTPLFAQQVAVPDGLIDALLEASEFISAVYEGAQPQTRYPLPDELSGFAAILKAQEAKP